MREIKFRAWDTKSKTWLIYWTQGQMVENKNDEVIVQQFTGLKDKNGKEIYEGDIIKFRIYPESESEKEVYVFDEIEFIAGCFILKNRVELLRTRMPYVEIIGNIFGKHF